MGLILLYVTFPTQESAQGTIDALMQEHLIACANLIESSSTYAWDGECKTKSETIAICKTTAQRAQAAKDAIIAAHPYDVPCVLELRADANIAFAAWAHERVK